MGKKMLPSGGSCVVCLVCCAGGIAEAFRTEIRLAWALRTQRFTAYLSPLHIPRAAHFVASLLHLTFFCLKPFVSRYLAGWTFLSCFALPPSLKPLHTSAGGAGSLVFLIFPLQGAAADGNQGRDRRGGPDILLGGRLV